MSTFDLTTLDVAVFLVAGILGMFAHWRRDNLYGSWSGSIAWFIIALWALLKLLKVFS